MALVVTDSAENLIIRSRYLHHGNHGLRLDHVPCKRLCKQAFASWFVVRNNKVPELLYTYRKKLLCCCISRMKKMPPKAEVTKEQVSNAAFDLTRQEGFEILTARNIALKLKCSTQPVYRLYRSMEEVKEDVFIH